MDDLVVANELNFQEEVLRSTLPVLVDVSTEWCAPCKLATPIVAQIAKERRGTLKVVMIDGNECPELVASLGVRGFPTFVGFVEGQAVERRAGFGGKRALEAMAEALVEKKHQP